MEKPNTILLELHYLPSIQYFTKLLKYEKILLETQENYSKGTYRNRCHIVAANGAQRLSIPLKKGKNRQQNIKEVEIAYHGNWQSEHWHSIKSAYGNSPFFEFYADYLHPFYREKEQFLWDWNFKLLETTMELIGMEYKIDLTKAYHSTVEMEAKEVKDCRNSIQPKKSRHKEDIAFKPVPYGQVFQERHGFLPNLSILDLLFCVGPGAGEILRKSGME